MLATAMDECQGVAATIDNGVIVYEVKLGALATKRPSVEQTKMAYMMQFGSACVNIP